jgi:predicted ATPase
VTGAAPLSGAPCVCRRSDHEPRLVVVTGGPGAGKTALLELARRHFCEHVTVLPEAAGIVFGGGFPRRSERAWHEAAQRAIYFVQRELERAIVEERPALVLCDRGTLDGAAYWPAGPEAWAAAVGTTLAAERARYAAVIELRTPPPSSYNHVNPLRVESAREAALRDERIDDLWAAHAERHVIPATPIFLDKVHAGLQAIESLLPMCCRSPAPR